jgi:glycosyltransferase involved in cell wall biosynthesis
MARCLESLVAQTFKDFEVLICDDGSTDATESVVRTFESRLNLSYHWAENFGGPARPRNAGVRLARGEYVAFLDSDDWWTPQKLVRAVERLDAGADLVYHDLFIVKSAQQRHFWRKQRTTPLATPVFDSLLRTGNVVPNSSVVVRRELVQRIGGFSEDRALIAWEDFDAWLRIAKLTERFERLPVTLGYYWLGGGNISSPQRTILILQKFSERYPEAGRAGPADSAPSWYHYGLGLAHYRLGNYRPARFHMRMALRQGLSLPRSAKALLTMLKANGTAIGNGAGG